MPPITFKSLLFAWQLPVFLAFVVAWLIGGSYLTRRALAGFSELPRSQRGMGRAAQVNFFATGAGLLALLIVAAFFAVLAKRSRFWPLVFRALVIGLPAMLATAWIVALNVLDLTRKQVLRVTLVTAGPILGLLLVLAVGGALPSWYLARARVVEQASTSNLRWLATALTEYARTEGHEAPSLRALTERRYVREAYLSYPAGPKGEEAYLYNRLTSAERLGQGSDTRVLLCERLPYQGGHRLLLLTNGNVDRVDESRFAELLALPANQQLRKLVADQK